MFCVIGYILPEDLSLAERTSVHGRGAKNKRVITNKAELFLSCESVDSTSYRPACTRQ